MVPVVDQNNIPLMPCTEKRARKLMERKEAIGFWKKGIFCIKLLREPSGRNHQKVIVGIDPGSSREGYTVSTENKIIINILTDTPTWIQEGLKRRRMMRKKRRFRKTPYRPVRSNRAVGGLAPSTKARWQAKLRVLNYLSKIIPITDVIARM